MRSIVKRGYDEGDYTSAYQKHRAMTAFEHRFVDAFVRLMPEGGYLLDWGPGTGVPFDLYLSSAGLQVTGVDISMKHVQSARRNVPEATYIEGDFTAFEPETPVDGLLCLYALFHVPRAEHDGIVSKARRLLRPGGAVLLTMGVRASSEMDVEDHWCGPAPMAWSHYDAATNLKMIRNAGFEVLDSADEAESGSAEHHLWVLARKLELRNCRTGLLDG